jgi:hypothetical protein
MVREGRWEEAEAFRETVRKTCKGDGMDSEMAVETSWDECERNFPTLTEVDEDREELKAIAEEEAAETEAAAEGNPSMPAASRSRARRIIHVPKTPTSWGEIPKTASLRVEVDWARQNRFLAVRHGMKTDRLDLTKCQGPAPSHYAVSILEWSMKNEHAFMNNLVPKVMSGSEEGGDAENVKRERMRIEDIRGILESLQETRDG